MHNTTPSHRRPRARRQHAILAALALLFALTLLAGSPAHLALAAVAAFVIAPI